MYQTLNPKTFLGITSVDDFWNWYAQKKRLSWGLQERESERERERERESLLERKEFRVQGPGLGSAKRDLL